MAPLVTDGPIIIAALWFLSQFKSINLFAAALAGILVPLTLDYFDIDPAIASGVFVTTVIDVLRGDA